MKEITGSKFEWLKWCDFLCLIDVPNFFKGQLKSLLEKKEKEILFQRENILEVMKNTSNDFYDIKNQCIILNWIGLRWESSEKNELE